MMRSTTKGNAREFARNLRPARRQRTAPSSTVDSGETRRCRAAESGIYIYHH